MAGSSNALLVGLALASVACRGNAPPPGGEQPPAGAGAGIPSTADSDTGGERHRMEGTNTGVEFEAPRRIPGVLAGLDQVKRQPDQTNLSAFRGDLGSMEDAMRADLTRAGLADTGEFQALTDSIGRDLGGGAGRLADAAQPGKVPRLEARVRRLIAVHDQMMRSARR